MATAEDAAMLPADRALLERLGARLREIRESAKLTQDEVAERAGFGGKYLGEIEKGLRDVPLSTLRAVVENGLGVQLDAVLAGKTRGTRRRRSADVPRDAMMIAEVIARLPIKLRRQLLGLVKEVARR